MKDSILYHTILATLHREALKALDRLGKSIERSAREDRMEQSREEDE